MSIEIKISKNNYNIDINDLIVMGSRLNNSNRNFLFISKVLGKHIEVKPDICRAIGFVLGSTIYGENGYTKTLVKFLKEQDIYSEEAKIAMKTTFKSNENVCVLGFSETATGLGMAVASAIDSCYYLTTTREDITGVSSMLNFEEEHSHATMHKCFPLNAEDVKNSERIILVDDEITTGKSMINIIRELTKITNIKKYTVLSILDWRSSEHKEMFSELENKESIEIEVLSLISGDVVINDRRVFTDNGDEEINSEQDVIELNSLDRIDIAKGNGEATYYRNSGRFGVYNKSIMELEQKCSDIAKKAQELIGDKKKILVLGHGENIYIPSRVAANIKGDVYFKSTTRSPIYCKNEDDYAIKQKHIFYDDKVKYYFYNKDYIEKNYDVVILITENDLSKKLCENLIIVKI